MKLIIPLILAVAAFAGCIGDASTPVDAASATGTAAEAPGIDGAAAPEGTEVVTKSAEGAWTLQVGVPVFNWAAIGGTGYPEVRLPKEFVGGTVTVTHSSLQSVGGIQLRVTDGTDVLWTETVPSSGTVFELAENDARVVGAKYVQVVPTSDGSAQALFEFRVDFELHVPQAPADA